MSFFVNLGYQFKIASKAVPNGSLILASSMPMHQLERRKFKGNHLKNCIFDPQLYLSSLDSSASRKHCAKLASYPWFNVKNLNEYQSAEQTQQSWMEFAKANIHKIWSGSYPDDRETIKHVVRDCVDLQLRLGCSSIILPSPLTVEPGTNYQSELIWLDSGITYINTLNGIDLPIYATLALSDICIRFLEPQDNPLLEIVLDSISAREVDGVYIVIEQASEPDDVRHCSNSKALRSVLELVHTFSKDAGLKVGVNFLGFFGLYCKAAGAEWWASNWYKSLYRVRIADKIAGGRAFPTYWSYKAASDINLDSDFDDIVEAGLLDTISDSTYASTGLITAAKDGKKVAAVPAWAYRQSNVTAAREHYLLSVIRQDERLSALGEEEKVELVEKWLQDAVATCDKVNSLMGNGAKTKTSHIQSWLNAFTSYRKDHKV